MRELKLKGLVSKIGISITKFHNISKIINNYKIDVFNYLIILLIEGLSPKKL